MDQVLKNEIMQYLKDSRLTTEVQVEEMVSVPLSKLYQEQDLVHTPEGNYYSKQEVFHYLKNNSYELTQENFEIAARHCYIPYQTDENGVPYKQVTHSYSKNSLDHISDEDLQTYLIYSLLQERTKPVTLFEYKVVTLKDTFWMGRTSSEALQDILNDHSSRGWRLKTTSVNQITNVVGSESRDELLLIFERQREN